MATKGQRWHGRQCGNGKGKRTCAAGSGLTKRALRDSMLGGRSLQMAGPSKTDFATGCF